MDKRRAWFSEAPTAVNPPRAEYANPARLQTANMWRNLEIGEQVGNCARELFYHEHTPTGADRRLPLAGGFRARNRNPLLAMTLDQTWETEALRDAAKRQALDAEKCATDLAIQLRIVERRLAEAKRMANMARLYVVGGQYEAARLVLESL